MRAQLGHARVHGVIDREWRSAFIPSLLNDVKQCVGEDGRRSFANCFTQGSGFRNFSNVDDRDGGLANVYGVAVCPQLTFVLPGGRVSDSSVGEISQRELGERLDRLTRAARKVG